MQVFKSAEERRTEILAVANQLFCEKGYDNTSITDILNKVKIAKGTLYYYFKSKEEIMNSIIEQITSKMFTTAKEISENPSLTVQEKILNVVMSLNIEGDKGSAVLDHIHNPQNALMHQKQLESLVKEITPILSKIVCDGIDEGLFTTPYPYESVEMILIYVQIAFDSQNNLSMDEYIKKISAFIFNLERITGAKPGCFDFVKQLFK